MPRKGCALWLWHFLGSFTNVFLYDVCFSIVLSPHLSFFSCLGKVVLCDCGISWEVSLMFSYMTFVFPLFYLYISPSFRASERLCFVIVAFSGDFHSCFHIWRLFCHCFISTSLLLLMSRKGCALWLWHFLGTFTYMFSFVVVCSSCLLLVPRGGLWFMMEPFPGYLLLYLRVLITLTTSKGSAKPARRRSLTRTFAGHRHVVRTLRKLQAKKKHV